MMVVKDALFFQKMFNMTIKSLWDREVANCSTYTSRQKIFEGESCSTMQYHPK
jgi:hypothetical protein